MMIARTERVKQWGLFTALKAALMATPLMVTLSMISSVSFAQSYSNPRYQGSSPRKGDSVQLPSYTVPSSGGYNSGYGTNGSVETGERSMEIGVNAHYPVGMGDAGGALKSRFGGDVQLYLKPFVSDDFNNYLSVGWDLFALKSDETSKLNLIPFAFGLETKTDRTKSLAPKFGIAVGGAFAWVGVTDSQTINGRVYFLAQVKPGLDINLDDFALVLQTPISFIVGSSRMSYVAYSLGARFGL